MRTDVGLLSGFRHHLTDDEVIFEEMHVEFVANAVRFFAPQMIHLHDDLQTSEIEFCVPAQTEHGRQIIMRVLVRIEQCRDDHKIPRTESRLCRPHTNLAESGRGRKAAVCLCIHPRRLWRLRPANELIVLPEMLSCLKVCRPQLMLANHNIDALLLQQCDIKPSGKLAVQHKYITFPECAGQSSQQTVFAGLFSGVRTDRRLNHTSHR
jgi:hypothetical protein